MSERLRIVGLVSCYREGRLVAGAIESLLEVGLDDLLVYEGPAGQVPEGIEQAPASELPPNGPLHGHAHRGHVHRGTWRTDARKRNQMVAEAKRRNSAGPIWGVWVDGDEVLENARYLRDRLQALAWADEAQLERDPEAMPTIRWPMRTIESDGSIALTTGRLVRLDLIRSYDISLSVVTNVFGIEEGFGNEHENGKLWLETWFAAAERGHLVAFPPFPGEPHLVHRSGLRHPARLGLRLHKQERDELIRAGKPVDVKRR